MTYEDNEKRKRTDTVVVPIKQIGGKPPSECSFDIDLSEFRCGFDIGERGYAAFTKKPEPKEKHFKIGDTLSLDFKIEKKSPKYNPTATDMKLRDPRLQIPFYLIYRVRNQQGKLVDLGGATTKQKVLIVDKTYGPEDFILPDIKFKASDLISSSSITVVCDPKGPDTGGTVIPSTTPSCPKKGGFTAEGSVVKYEITEDVKVDSKTKKSSAKYQCWLGQYDKNMNPIKGSFKKHGKIETTTDGKLKCAGVIVQAPIARMRKGQTYRLSVKSTITSKKAEKECRDYTTTTPAKWKAELELRYCEPLKEATYLTPDNCKPSKQVVVFNGQPQQFVGASAIEMNLICQEAKKSKKCTKFNQLLRLAEGCDCGGTTCGKSEVIGLDYCKKEGSSDPKCITYVPCNNAKADKREKDLVQLSPGNPDYRCDCDGGRAVDKTDMECRSDDACVDIGTKTESKYVCKKTK